MESKSITLAKRARYQKWINEIQSCRNRPKGMTVGQWCTENGIKYSTYYQHYLKVKDLCLEQMDLQLPEVQPHPAFVELKVPTVIPHTDSVSVLCGKAKIEISEDVSETFLVKLFGALNHVE